LISFEIDADLNKTTAVLDASDVTIPDSTIRARYVFLYKDTGDSATFPLVACIKFGAEKALKIAILLFNGTPPVLLILGNLEKT
jgi:hypothetical protein